MIQYDAILTGRSSQVTVELGYEGGSTYVSIAQWHAPLSIEYLYGLCKISIMSFLVT